MNQRALLLAAFAFIAIVALMFGYAYLKKSEIDTPKEVFVPVPESTTEVPLPVNAVHFFENGTHILVGEVLMPTPCDLIETDARVAESMPEQVTVAFTVINNANACAQVLTPQRFRVEFAASASAKIAATWNGVSVVLNLRDAEAGETPGTLEDLYFKG